MHYNINLPISLSMNNNFLTDAGKYRIGLGSKDRKIKVITYARDFIIIVMILVKFFKNSEFKVRILSFPPQNNNRKKIIILIMDLDFFNQWP